MTLQDQLAKRGAPAPHPAPIRAFFMGSGEIAVPALAALAATPGIELVGVATQPDRACGRRRQPMATPVGRWCVANRVTVHKPASVNRPEFQHLLTALDLDLIVVFAFGQILKDSLLRLPGTGSVNVHASLLPAYRGAAPVNAAILNGERHAGISIMEMTSGLDAGPVYARYAIELRGDETTLTLERRLAALAAERIGPALAQIVSGDLRARAQVDAHATYAPKLEKLDGEVKWTASATCIERQVRAYHPWPGAWFVVPAGKGDQRLTITAAAVVPGQRQALPGEYLQADKHDWIVACGRDALRIDRVIPEGRKEMTGAEYLRGRPSLKGLQTIE